MKISVKQIKRPEMDERSERGSHQGLMLETGSYQYSNVNEIVIAANKRAETNDGKALIVVLDHITDAGNLGAIAVRQKWWAHRALSFPTSVLLM